MGPPAGRGRPTGGISTLPIVLTDGDHSSASRFGNGCGSGVYVGIVSGLILPVLHSVDGVPTGGPGRRHGAPGGAGQRLGSPLQDFTSESRRATRVARALAMQGPSLTGFGIAHRTGKHSDRPPQGGQGWAALLGVPGPVYLTNVARLITSAFNHGPAHPVAGASAPHRARPLKIDFVIIGFRMRAPPRSTGWPGGSNLAIPSPSMAGPGRYILTQPHGEARESARGVSAT
jgi:hypothetical protein